MTRAHVGHRLASLLAATRDNQNSRTAAAIPRHTETETSQGDAKRGLPHRGPTCSCERMYPSRGGGGGRTEAGRGLATFFIVLQSVLVCGCPCVRTLVGKAVSVVTEGGGHAYGRGKLPSLLECFWRPLKEDMSVDIQFVLPPPPPCFFQVCIGTCVFYHVSARNVN